MPDVALMGSVPGQSGLYALSRRRPGHRPVASAVLTLPPTGLRARPRCPRRRRTGGFCERVKFEKTLNHFQRVLETEDAFADLEKIDDLDGERALELHNTLISLKMKCEELQQKIKDRVPRYK